jgi:dUTP pyrophosphatase
MLKVKKLNRFALSPVKEEGDAGYDLYSCEDVVLPGNPDDLEPDELPITVVRTGIACEFPSTHVGRIVDRSGGAVKEGLHVVAGVMDSRYRGEWLIAFYNMGRYPVEIKSQTRIAQVLFYRVADWPVVDVDELSETTRGAGRFGSTGKE